MSLPSAIPPDCVFVYAWIDPDTEMLKIALEHKDFPVNTAGSYVTKHEVIIKEVPPIPDPFSSYDPNAKVIDPSIDILETENFSRSI